MPACTLKSTGWYRNLLPLVFSLPALCSESSTLVAGLACLSQPQFCTELFWGVTFYSCQSLACRAILVFAAARNSHWPQTDATLTVFPITHNCGFQFWRTDMRLVHPADAYIFSKIETIDSESENKREVQRAKPRLHHQITIRNADWFQSHSRKFYSNAGWLKIHFFSQPTLQVCGHY